MDDKKPLVKIKVFQAPIIYFLVLSLFLISTYSIYFIFSNEEIREIAHEDGIFEYLSFFSFIFASFLYFKSYKKNKNIYLLLFSLLMFVAAGEEISWGQRIIGFETPEFIEKNNVQKEFNLHNIEIFNARHANGESKKGISRLLEVNFLFKLFCITYCFILPLSTTLIPKINTFISNIHLPIPPLIFGLIFIFNWFSMRLLIDYDIVSYTSYLYEIMETNAAFMLLALAFYFNKNSKLNFHKN